jgi:hypothetical protein
MAFAFSEVTPPTRVWSNTDGGADEILFLAAVFTVMPLYDLAQQAGGTTLAW